MAEEIAVILGVTGTTGTLNEPGTITVFSRNAGAWEKERELPFVLDPAKGLRDMRVKMAGVLEFLKCCKIIVTQSASGAPYFELEKAGLAIWEITGKPEEFLDQVWADEEKEKKPSGKAPAADVPRPKEKTPGNFVISIKEIQGKRPDLSSKQVLQQFIQSGGFLVLEIVCSHVPPWIEVEAERRGYTLESEQIDNNSVKVLLTTNVGR
ncbi:MAG: Fe-only nitrogenase accessory AnfO family protein [Methanoregula sp.]|jgi:Fe-only nitrogenase accessory protein AnfO